MKRSYQSTSKGHEQDGLKRRAIDKVCLHLIHVYQWSRKMFDIGGPNFFGDIYMYTYACICFTCVKHNRNF